MSNICELPIMLRNTGYEVVHQALGLPNMRLWDWERISDSLSGHLKVFWDLFSCRRIISADTAREALGDMLFQALLLRNVVELTGDTVRSRYIVMPVGGMYAFVSQEIADPALRDNQFVGLQGHTRQGDHNSVAVLFSNIGIDAAILSRSTAETWCISASENLSLIELNVEMNRANVTVRKDACDLEKAGAVDQIFCEPPCLLSLPRAPLPQVVSGGPLGDEKICDAIRIAGRTLTANGAMDLIAIGYGTVNSVQGCFSAEAYDLLKQFDLCHTTLVTTKTPLKSGPGSPIFNQTVQFASKANSEPILEISKEYESAFEAAGFVDASFFRCRIKRRDDQDKDLVFDVSNNYYGTWSL